MLAVLYERTVLRTTPRTESTLASVDFARGLAQPLITAFHNLSQPHCTCDCSSHLVSPCTSKLLAMLLSRL